MFRPQDYLRFVQWDAFTRAWLSYGLTDADLQRLEGEILANPKSGSVVPGTGGLRKLRMARWGKGKSGGYRVYYVSLDDFGIVLLLTIFAKNEKGDLSQSDRQMIRQLVESIRDGLKGRNDNETK